jgi:monoamine oxidase
MLTRRLVSDALGATGTTFVAVPTAPTVYRRFAASSTEADHLHMDGAVQSGQRAAAEVVLTE